MKTDLAKREKEILVLILKEHTTVEIAALLSLSVHTVDTHRKNILRKTKSGTLVALIKYAIKEGLIEGFYYKGRAKKTRTTTKPRVAAVK